MESYDPMEHPDPDQWLALDEDERIFLIVAFHERARVNLPNVQVQPGGKLYKINIHTGERETS